MLDGIWCELQGSTWGWGRRWRGTRRPSLRSGGHGPPSCALIPLQYKSTPGKKVSIVGWMVQLPDDPEHPDIFQLNNPDKGRPRAWSRCCCFSQPCFLLC